MAKAPTCRVCGVEHWRNQPCIEAERAPEAEVGAGLVSRLNAAAVARAGFVAPVAKKGRPSLGKPWEAERISRAAWFARRKKENAKLIFYPSGVVCGVCSGSEIKIEISRDRRQAKVTCRACEEWGADNASQHEAINDDLPI